MDHEGTSSLIGVGIAVLANTLISAGLNVERLAHIRRSDQANRDRAGRSNKNSAAHEQTPLLDSNKVHPSRTETETDSTSGGPRSHSREPNRSTSHASGSSRKRSASSASSKSNKRPLTDKGFLRSPLWLGGFCLINLGEVGNFLAYGFAPTSLVAPLGMTALVANVFLAPAIVGEPFKRRDLVGIAIAIVGGATVVYASRSSDTKITPSDLLLAFRQPLFIAYTVVSCVAMAGLAWLSQTRLGDKFVLIDLSLCALAGSFTVLSTKALSSFLNLMFLDAFRHWIAYPVLLVLLATAFLQVNFINKSLQRFESRVVIPTQYMTFALMSIIGSAILYGDFKGMSASKLLNFGFGCLVSAAGVYLLTREDEVESHSSASSKPSNQKERPRVSSSTSSTRQRLDPQQHQPRPDTQRTTQTPQTSRSIPNTSYTQYPSSLSASPKSPRSIKRTTSLADPESLVHLPYHPSSSYSSLSLRPDLRGQRKLSVGRFAGGGYLLVGSPSGRREEYLPVREEETQESEDEQEEEEEDDGESGSESTSEERTRSASDQV
ncbi:uncharacterized protein JCM15063_002556 [Sporobolomyces koalae]|uniref:uncharacterized protein n=1 Tax=Sporobolomyces koalae TaxID=500713 RepID=UPI003181F55C